MIIDKLENARLYAGISKKIAKGLAILKEMDFCKQEDGKYEVNDNLFYIVQRYKSKPFAECRLEAHRKHIDIQYLVAGDEFIGYAPFEGLKIKQKYEDKKDVGFYKVPDKISMVELMAGMFCILFPHDAHMPCIQFDGPMDILKVVVKVRM